MFLSIFEWPLKTGFTVALFLPQQKDFYSQKKDTNYMHPFMKQGPNTAPPPQWEQQ